MMDGDERDAALMLAVHVEPGDRTVREMVVREGYLHAWNSVRSERALDQAEPAAMHHERARKAGLRIVLPGELEWPEQLRSLGSDMPFALWVNGAANLRLACLRSVSIVGARAATPYGLRISHDWAAATSDARATVISGAAIGIDGAAHRGALMSEGITVAVLAGGVDVAYPRAHEQLLARIADEGLLVSESPPGARPLRHRFLTRNRVIAALSSCTVIVEAAHRSGTIATAHAAARLGREVFAVPGPVTSDMSDGCHRLISDGVARIARSAPDLLDCLLSLEGQVRASADRDAQRDAAAQRVTDGLTPEQCSVLDAIPGTGARDLDGIVRRSELAVTRVLLLLGQLELRGLLIRLEGGWSRRA